MTFCVIYVFAQLRRQTKHLKEWPINGVNQWVQARHYVMEHGYDEVLVVAAHRTSRNHHFADTPEFRNAVRIARESRGDLIIGSVYELLCVTKPEQIESALATLLAVPIKVIDANVGGELTKSLAAAMIRPAQIRSNAKRAPIRQGLKAAGFRSCGAINQPAGARGAKKAGEKYLAELGEIVDEVKSALPADAILTRAHLAAELNRRDVLTRQGKKWTPENAGRVLRKMSMPMD